MPGAAGVTVYGAPYSVYVQITLLALLEKGVPHALEPIDIFAPGPAVDAYARINPFRKIPALRHGDLVLYETPAITRYVDEAFEGPALQPSTPAKRALMMQVIGIVASYAYPTLIWQVYVPHTRGERPTMESVESASLCLGELARLLGGDRFFGGDRPSLADLHLAPVFGYFRGVPEAAPLLADYERAAAWWRDIEVRASWQAISRAAADQD